MFSGYYLRLLHALLVHRLTFPPTININGVLTAKQLLSRSEAPPPQVIYLCSVYVLLVTVILPYFPSIISINDVLL